MLSASFGPKGTLLTAGRDRVVRYWSPEGNPLKVFPTAEALPLVVRISHDGKFLIAGDSAGEVHFWPTPE